MKRTGRKMIAALVAGAIVLAVTGNGVAQSIARSAPSHFLQKHCIRCHGPDRRGAGFRIDTLDTTFADNRSAEAWVEVLNRINLDEMPPENEPRPAAEELNAAVNWITERLEMLRDRAHRTGGRVLLRRLTRTEYANTVRDLLGVTFLQGEGPEDLLPPDGSVEGFNKISSALLVDPSLLESYLAVAERIADRAVRVRPPLVPTRTMRFEYENTHRAAGITYQLHSPRMDLAPRGVLVYDGAARTGNEIKHPFNGQSVPVTGRYVIRVRAAADPGERGEPIYMDIMRGRQGRLQRFRVDAPLSEPRVYTFEGILDASIHAELRVEMVNRQHYFEANPLPSLENLSRADLNDDSQQNANQRTLARYHAEGYGRYRGRPNLEYLDKTKVPRLFLDYFELEGPLHGPWPPRSMQVIFPGGLRPERQSAEDARRIFRRLLPRAYRRPVTARELEVVVELVKRELELGNPFQEAVKAGIVGMLSSPQFLYLFEHDAGGRASGVARRPPQTETLRSRRTGVRPLSGFEMATRLSYFLWSSKPDDELFRAARDGRLSDVRDLNRQIERMLADTRAEALVDDFAFQWFRISEFDRFAPDQGIFPEYYNLTNAGVGDDMKAEPLEMFREILRKDRSILNFLDSDWTMLNERLARFYGIGGVTGDAFRRVALPEGSPRGGLLGMAGLHKWGSDGNRTKPVARGQYVLDVLFADPSPPPPPNAGEVQPNGGGQNLTVRERLEKHRAVAACANCHRRIDPYGLALENFNVIGQWRTEQDGEKPLAHWGNRRRPLAVNGALPNGDAYENFAEFKQAIVRQQNRFVRGLAQKMLTYALCRPMEASDQPTIDRVAGATRDGHHTLRAMIKAVVATDAFQTK